MRSTVTCADSGTVTLTSLPDFASYKTVTGSFKAAFGAVTVSGSFDGKSSPVGAFSCKK